MRLAYSLNDGTGRNYAESAATGTLNEIGQPITTVRAAVASSNSACFLLSMTTDSYPGKTHKIQGALDLRHTRYCVCESHALWCLVSTVDRHWTGTRAASTGVFRRGAGLLVALRQVFHPRWAACAPPPRPPPAYDPWEQYLTVGMATVLSIPYASF